MKKSGQNKQSQLCKLNFQNADVKLNALLNAAADAIIIIDHRGKIELFNATAELMFGYQSRDVVGNNVKMLMPEPYQSEHDQYLKNYTHTNRVGIIGIGREIQARKKNGEIFPIELSVGEVKDATHKQFVGIIRDITERIQFRLEVIDNREHLNQITRLNTMAEMAAGIAHEINQPLTAISSYAQACKNILNISPDSSVLAHFEQQKLVDTLEKISNQALRAAKVIQRLRSSVKKRPSQRDWVDLNQLIKDTINLAKIDTRLLDHSIELHLTLEPKPVLLLDPIQIQQVLFNLIRNAFDAMEEQPNEAIKIHSRWLNQQFIEVAVSDRGQGVRQENKQNLFQPFFTTKTAGMGMGLAICQSIIQSHGGELKHRNGDVSGSVFFFTLPAKPIDYTLITTEPDN